MNSVGCYTTTRNKYTYACCTSTASGVAVASQRGGCLSGAAGNSTRGIFTLGLYVCACNFYYSANRNKYTYASCTSTACGVGAAQSSTSSGSAAGNSTRGIFSIGCRAGTGGTTIRNKYTYASCTNTACVGAASQTSKYNSAVSWATCVNS